MVFEEPNSELISELNLLVEEHPKKINKNINRRNLSLEVFKDVGKIWCIKIER
jgi:hypothetical protein